MKRLLFFLLMLSSTATALQWIWRVESGAAGLVILSPTGDTLFRVSEVGIKAGSLVINLTGVIDSLDATAVHADRIYGNTTNATDSALAGLFIGPVRGNVTGDVSGNAATASNAALLQGKDTNTVHVYVGRDSAKVQKGDSVIANNVAIGIGASGYTNYMTTITRGDTTGFARLLFYTGIKEVGAMGFRGNGTIKNSFSVDLYGKKGFSVVPPPGWAGGAAPTYARVSIVNMNPQSAFTVGGNVAIGATYADAAAAPANGLLVEGATVICSTAARTGKELFVKGDIAASGHGSVDSTLTVGTILVGNTVMVRTAGAAFAATKRFQTYVDSCAGVDSIQLTALNAAGARARVITLRDSVFVKDGATVVKILDAAGKWADFEYLGAPCNRWCIFGSN